MKFGLAMCSSCEEESDVMAAGWAGGRIGRECVLV